ncbi:MAG TPA: DUF4339 domain-containing protein [Desulfuromonadaceae bacterium]|nr:DUF4339 domain-containing protein [Desulfuromonadaceae bacterium]
MGNYTIIGDDGKPYGPVADYELPHWIKDGRVDADTQIQPEGEKEWKRLADLPEFARSFKPRPETAPVITSSAPVTLADKIKIPRRFILPAAVAGGILLLVALVTVALALGKMGGKKKAMDCFNNEKQLAMAVRIYTARHNEHLPPSAAWCDAIKGEVSSEKAYQCPTASHKNHCDYAFNAKLGGLDLVRVDPHTVMLFEADGGWNTSGGPELLRRRSRHGRVINIAFADGSVQQLSPAQLDGLRWNP